MHLSLDKITIDAGTQSRVTLDKSVIEDYAESMKDGAKFPPCIVISDGEKNYLVDGFHRYFAARKIGVPSLDCTVTDGTLDDAVVKSWSVNNKHGLRPSLADRRKSVLSALSHPLYMEKSSREIAEVCNVSHTLVLSIKKEIEDKQPSQPKPAAQPKPAEEKPVEVLPENDSGKVFEEEMIATIELLKAENEALSDKLAVASMDADDIDRAMAESTIKDLRAQIRMLEIELKAVTDSRDSLQRENAQLMKQVNSLIKKIKKFEQ